MLETPQPRSELRCRGGIRRWFFGCPQAGRARQRSARPLVCRWRQSRAEPAPDRKRGTTMRDCAAIFGAAAVTLDLCTRLSAEDRASS